MSTTTPTPANHQHATRDYPALIFCTRLASIDNDVHSIDAVLASESSVEVWDPRRGQVIDEILLLSGAKLPNQMPLLDMHDRTIEKTIGSIRNLRREGGQIIGRLFFTTGDARSEKVWNIVKQGHITDVSVGYRVQSAIDIPAGRTQAVNGRSFTAKDRTLRVATEWTPYEGSLVPIGADPSAKTRDVAAFEISNRHFSTPSSNERENFTMPAIHTGPNLITREILLNALYLKSNLRAQTEELGNRAASISENLTLNDVCRYALEAQGHDVRGNDYFREAVELNAVQQLFEASANANLMAGWAAEEDVTESIAYVANCRNYKSNQRFIIEDGETLDPVPRGGTANIAEFDFLETDYKIAKFAKRFILDEQDALDGGDLSALTWGPQLLGRAAARLRGDLVFSMLLENDELEDGKPIFHEDRGNLSDQLLSLESLSVDRSAMASRESESGIHRGARPDVIVVSERKAMEAASIVKTFAGVPGNVQMSVYGESRLDQGVFNPLNNNPVNAEPQSMFLFAKNQRGIEIGVLNGRKTPRLRMTRLEQGEWGYEFSIDVSIGAKLICPHFMHKNKGLSA